MTWEDFVDKVKENLLDDADRVGTETLVTNLIRSGVIDLQSFIPRLRVGHETIYDPDDLEYQGFSARGSLPDQANVKDVWLVTTGTPMVRQPLSTYPWEHRHDMVAGDIATLGSSGLIAIDPGSASFFIHPAPLTTQHLSVTYDGMKLEFADSEEVLFDEVDAMAVAAYVRAGLAVPVQNDIRLAEFWKGEYATQRRARFLAYKRQSELDPSTRSPQALTGCPGVSSSEDTFDEVVFVGDSGVESLIADTAAVAAGMLSSGPDVVIHGGDLTELSNASNLQQFFLKYFGSPVAASKLYVAVGEKDLDSNLGDDVIAAIPGSEDWNEGHLYYDFEVGGIHFFVLNGNKLTGGSTAISADGVGAGSAQETWLETAMEDSTADWKVVVIHTPPYSSDAAITPGVTAWRLDYKTLGADLVLSAHSKTYERLMVDGLNYIVCGTGGAQAGTFGSAISGSQVRYSTRPGYLRIQADATTMRVDFNNIDGKRIDSIVLSQ